MRGDFFQNTFSRPIIVEKHSFFNYFPMPIFIGSYTLY